jgi:hypothetical protein
MIERSEAFAASRSITRQSRAAIVFGRVFECHIRGVVRLHSVNISIGSVTLRIVFVEKALQIVLIRVDSKSGR